jgi:PmbA protein
MDQTQANEILEKALALSECKQAEVVIEEEDFALTRLAENVIHQNIARTDLQLIARLIEKGQSGVALRNQASEEAIKQTVAAAAAAARQASGEGGAIALPPKQPLATDDRPLPALTSPGDRARTFKTVVDAGASKGLKLAGEFRTALTTTAVASSPGTRQFCRETYGLLSITATTAKGGTAYAHAAARDAGTIDAGAIAERVAARALATENPIDLAPGDYTVVLEPPAVGQLLLFLGFMGFGARTLSRSFMTQKIGEKIISEKITIVDDVHNLLMVGMPFDYEGVPRQTVPLIEKGVAKGVVCDTAWGKRLGQPSTGHALPATNSFGPYPRAMVMSGGDSSLAGMIAGTDRGLLISHFWYMNYANPLRTQITGTTYEGTMLIEGGKATKGVSSMRCLQSILEALTNVELISKDQELYQQFNSFMLVPALKIAKFTFIPES